MAEPITYIDVADNVAVRMMHFQASGDTHNGHIHKFDHLSILARGAVRIEFNDGVQEHTAPCLIMVPKLVRHQFVATQPDTVLCCVHAVREGEAIEDVAPQDIIEEQAKELLVKFPVLVEH